MHRAGFSLASILLLTVVVAVFAAGIATLPMNDPEAAVEEAERAIKDLRLRGVEVYTDIGGKPLDSPEFMPLYEKMEGLGRPLFIHPRGLMSTPDYEGESFSYLDEILEKSDISVFPASILFYKSCPIRFLVALIRSQWI